MVVIEMYTLIDLDQGHRKYYRLQLIEPTNESPAYQVLSHWGRIGGPHQGPTRKPYPDEEKARAAIAKRIKAMERDGYARSDILEIAALETGPLEPPLQPIEYGEPGRDPPPKAKKPRLPEPEQLKFLEPEHYPRSEP